MNIDKKVEKNANNENNSENLENQFTEIEKLKEQISDLENKNLLSLANLENQRKRYQKTIEEVEKFSSKGSVLMLLNFFDELRRILTTFKKTITNFENKLEFMNIKEIETKIGGTVNSNYHEIIEKVEDNNLKEGTIVEIIEKGYLIHNRILRPSRVAVAISKKTDEKSKSE